MLPNIPFFAQFPTPAFKKASTNRSIKAKEGYFRIRLLDMAIGRNWVLTTIRMPTFLIDLKHPHESQITSIYDPLPDLRQATSDGDVANIARNSVITQRTLSPFIPHHDEQGWHLTLSLFSIPIVDLASPMIDMLSVVSSFHPHISASLHITNVVLNSINAVLHLDKVDAKLHWLGEIGSNKIIQDEIYVVGPNDLLRASSKLSLKYGRLHFNNEPVKNHDYFVFHVKVNENHDEWIRHPSIKPTYDAWKLAYYLGDEQIEDRANELVTRIVNSTELVEAHKEEIISEIKNHAPEPSRDTDLSMYTYRNEESLNNINLPQGSFN